MYNFIEFKHSLQLKSNTTTMQYNERASKKINFERGKNENERWLK